MPQPVLSYHQKGFDHERELRSTKIYKASVLATSCVGKSEPAKYGLIYETGPGRIRQIEIFLTDDDVRLDSRIGNSTSAKQGCPSYDRLFLQVALKSLSESIRNYARTFISFGNMSTLTHPGYHVPVICLYQL